MRSVENLRVHELIGLRVLVLKSTSKPYMGVRGRVIDETKNTLRIETERGEKVIPKKACVFRFFLGKEHADIDGREICYRPEDRPKKLW